MNEEELGYVVIKNSNVRMRSKDGAAMYNSPYTAINAAVLMSTNSEVWTSIRVSEYHEIYGSDAVTNLRIKEAKREDMNAFLDAFEDFSVMATERKIWRSEDQIRLFGIYMAGVTS